MKQQFYQISKHFQFELPQYSHTGIYLHTLLVEGYATRIERFYHADIDRVLLESMDVKPLLEVNGGMPRIKKEAHAYVKQMFRNKLKQAA